MDPRLNPFAPGAGTPPPELTGRDDLIESASIALDRIAGGLSARSMVLFGLRGVGKTVLLNHIRMAAEANGVYTVPIEAPEGRSLPAILLPSLRSSVIRVSRTAVAKAGLQKVLNGLASFAKAFKLTYEDIEFSVDLTPSEGVADSGDLENDLGELLTLLGQHAAQDNTVFCIFIDELQYVAEDQLAALITALHRVNQAQLPVTVFAAGLPQLLGQLGKAKSYAERLFDFREIGALGEDDARDAITLPAAKQNVQFQPDAIREIIRATQCYPYFLQEWGQHSWRFADRSPITFEHASSATDAAIAQLDTSFFRVRFDRLTPSEKRYMRAMAELGPGPHRSGDVAEILQRKVTSLAPTRSSLIRKGMAYSPAHGDIAFTVPLFDGFMKRIMNLQRA
ncbi:MAG: ATP-binding protein [Planctomycetota bacterium]